MGRTPTLNPKPRRRSLSERAVRLVGVAVLVGLGFVAGLVIIVIASTP